ncbi:Helicase/UvrB, N-terminal [Trema orientale]|uniref:Helicase/UvrB, N-terminal n=1 Tax=Trema orientale TaxID=63057 RepID=A0A2P5FHB2_TREOI|nr:Helicase/UvrB, N-terminal [Trema orientale]
MDDEARVSGNSVSARSSVTEEVRPSYWLDACEDLSCDLIGDLVDFGDASVMPDSLGGGGDDRHGSSCNQVEEDGLLVSDFFGGIDHILDSFKNGDGLPPVPDFSCNGNGNGCSDDASAAAVVVVGGSNGTRSCTGLFQNGASSPVSKTVELSVSQPDAIYRNIVQNGSRNSECNGEFGQVNKLVNGNGREVDKENGVRKHEKRGVECDERCGKRARVGGNGKNERYGSGRGQFHLRERDRERCPSRKRTRDWDEIDRRDRDYVRRKEHYSNNRRDGRERDSRDREQKGYWERDKSGSNELVFRYGAYEADRSKEVKVANDKTQESNGKEESKSEETKEKIPEEQARQYQLDVLEQAKKKNTIAFLETGAGKTLIAVLLIKSLSNDLQKQNKKLLSVFLVPKVPLVYQQAEAIRERTGYQVGHYCGEMGQDFWDARRWQREFETKQHFEIIFSVVRVAKMWFSYNTWT